MTNYPNLFDRHTDYKTTFKLVVDTLTKAVHLPVAYRNAEVNDLCEAYFAQTGEMPDPAQLERLANFLLADTLTDKNAHKSKNEEYPILSDTQLELRSNRELSTIDMNIHTSNAKYKPTGRKTGKAGGDL